MRRFARLFQRLDRSPATLDKRAALVDYLREAPAADAAWGLWLLGGRKVGGAGARLATTGELRRWIAQVSSTPPWLVEEAHHHVGDLAETLTLLLDDPPVDQQPALSLATWIEDRLLPRANDSEAQRRAVVEAAWRSLPETERLVFNKLLTGNLRVGVSQGLIQQALAHTSGVPIATIAQRMLGDWTPTADFMERLLRPVAQAGGDEDPSAPYPFFLCAPIEQDVESLGPVADWLLEWKWDGIRLQLIRRGDTVALWSRGEERLDGRFPEIEAAARALPGDGVIDGELLAWGEGDQPLPFTVLQKRIQRRRPGATTLRQAPVRLVAYDLLESAGQDLRAWPLSERRRRLAELLAGCAPEVAGGCGPAGGDSVVARPVIRLSPEVAAADWGAAAALRAQARVRGVEGLMIKRRASAYQHGRKRGDWWKWKIGPLTIDAVLIYAQAGHGRRSTLYTDYTFGLWDGEALVPVAKAYSGLSDAEILELDRWIRAHTLERFGPVRSVDPHWVFELGFEAVNRSARHKSGVAVRFPRILRWRRDKPVHEADRLETLKDQAR